MLMPFLMIIAGFGLLIVGAEYTVRGSVAIANKLRIPPLVIGMTIVAFGTSAPEFVVSINAALTGAQGIAIGNVVGSNIANLLLILGFAAMVYPVTSNRKIFIRDYAALLLVTLLFVVFALAGSFVRWHGIVMLSLLLAFLVYNYHSAKAGRVEMDSQETSSPLASRGWLLVLTVTAFGLVAIIYGSDLLVAGSVALARILGVSEEIIGLTIIAFGTSLPELATTGMAAFRRQNDVALGNIVGSNIWNIVFIMGGASTIVNIPVPVQFLRYDIWVMLGATLLLFPLMYTKNRLSRGEGLVFVLAYLIYIMSQILLAKGIWNFG